ncbi:hypothetical protein BCR33DRAFT_11587 [Rhizoclosmatium globosum]|uniref:F-box domain-containing protein n=1 Tax=Rhizoclosmatium globosum TaxID=329046 RepID=A0A1Y2D5S0_9FUNG|nr:hypothetical protein BCR33DRAFT_11587 [Rhizoclosmatium globosum]|eukprot:ORY53915.1 hypothetical protein BCR33DRAFT_11587 [Rhizoclosmatium globosum]
MLYIQRLCFVDDVNRYLFQPESLKLRSTVPFIYSSICNYMIVNEVMANKGLVAKKNKLKMGSNCNTQVACCSLVPTLQTRNSELELLLSNALADINTLRSLLYAPPITDIQNALLPSPPTTSTQSRRTIHTQHSIPSIISLESLPDVILDRIASFTDSKSIIPLCHAVPYYKYISKAMYDMASENNSLCVDLLWPTFELDPDFSTLYKTQLNLFNYSRVLKKHGLMISFDMHDFEFVNEIGPYLTPTVSVFVRVSLRSEEVAHLLQLLRKYGVECVDYLDVDENNYDDSVVRDFFQPAIESVQQLLDLTKKNLNPNLSKIEVDGDIPPNELDAMRNLVCTYDAEGWESYTAYRVFLNSKKREYFGLRRQKKVKFQ